MHVIQITKTLSLLLFLITPVIGYSRITTEVTFPSGYKEWISPKARLILDGNVHFEEYATGRALAALKEREHIHERSLYFYELLNDQVRDKFKFVESLKLSSLLVRDP